MMKGVVGIHRVPLPSMLSTPQCPGRRSSRSLHPVCAAPKQSGLQSMQTVKVGKGIQHFDPCGL